MAAEPYKTDLAKTFSDFLLNAEVCSTYTLDEFRELFPQRYRDHTDVKILYKSFQANRKKTKSTVRRNIKCHCSKEKNTERVHKRLLSTNHKERKLKQELAGIKKDISAIENRFYSCAERLETTNMFKGLNKKYFQINKLQNLCQQLGIEVEEQGT